MNAHSWQKCPGPQFLNANTGEAVPAYDEACRTVWTGLEPLAKLNFHKATCLNQVNASTLATVRHVLLALRKLGVPV